MLASSVENKRAQCTGNGNCGELLKELCSQLNVPLPEDGFSAELIGVLFSSLTSIQIPKDLSPLELIRYVLRILSEEVVRAPLDHLDAKELLQGQPETVQVYFLFQLLHVQTAVSIYCTRNSRYCLNCVLLTAIYIYIYES